MLAALVVDGGFLGHVLGGFAVAAIPTFRRHVALTISAAIAQSNDVALLPVFSAAYRAPADATLAAVSVEDADSDAGRGHRVIVFANPFINAAHRRTSS